jgi:hypothetical protein
VLLFLCIREKTNKRLEARRSVTLLFSEPETSVGVHVSLAALP